MNGGINAAANRTRQNKVVYLNRNFLLPPEYQVFYTGTCRSWHALKFDGYLLQLLTRQIGLCLFNGCLHSANRGSERPNDLDDGISCSARRQYKPPTFVDSTKVGSPYLCDWVSPGIFAGL
jgi:hypothetical protein